MRLSHVVNSVSTCEADTYGPAMLKEHFANGMAFPYFDAMRTAIVQEQLIEAWAPNLVGMRILLVGFAKVPAPGRFFLAPDHGGPPFRQESRPFNGWQNTKLLQHRDAGREQRLADVVTR